jgi:dienelactone hydrolase
VNLRRRLLAALALAPWGAQAGPAAAAGPQVMDLDWHDPSRRRDVPARLYLPPAGGAAPLPLVVFSHGFGGTREDYAWLAHHLAGHGVASLHPQHVGSDFQVWLGGPAWWLAREWLGPDMAAERVARVADLRFVLDRLFSGPLAPLLDARRVVAAGHSFGAQTALLATGGRLRRDGGQIDLLDRRFKAAIAMSVPPFPGEGEPAAILGGVAVPSLQMCSAYDFIVVPPYASGPDERVALFEATGGERKLLALFSGGTHGLFQDPRDGLATAMGALCLAFMRSVLDGDEAPLADWPQRHAGVLARFEQVRQR